MATNVKDLTTVANVKSLLSISASTYDVLLQTLITAVSIWLEQRLDRSFYDSGEDITEYHHGGVDYYQLKKYPNTSVTSVSYRSGDFDNPTWTAYNASTDYNVDPDTGEIFFTFCLPAGRRNIQIVYSGGYETPVTLAPQDIRLACEKLVVKAFNKRQAEGVSSESIGDLNINWMANEEKETLKLLEPYKRLSV